MKIIRPDDMIVEPDSTLLGPIGIVAAEDDVPEPQAVGLERRHHPAEEREGGDLRVAVVVGRQGVGQAGYALDLRLLGIGREGLGDAAVDVGEEAVAPDLDRAGVGLDRGSVYPTLDHSVMPG